MKRSRLEVALDAQLEEAGMLDDCVREYRFHPTRKWLMDWAWPSKKLYAECQGGVFVRGRHSRPKGQLNDFEKTSEATILGWRPLFFCSVEIKNGQALDRIRRALLFDSIVKKG